MMMCVIITHASCVDDGLKVMEDLQKELKLEQLGQLDKEIRTRLVPVLVEVVAKTAELSLFRKMEMANKLRMLLKCNEEL